MSSWCIIVIVSLYLALELINDLISLVKYIKTVPALLKFGISVLLNRKLQVLIVKNSNRTFNWSSKLFMSWTSLASLLLILPFLLKLLQKIIHSILILNCLTRHEDAKAYLRLRNHHKHFLTVFFIHIDSLYSSINQTHT